MQDNHHDKIRIPRPRKACTHCRSMKTRCLPETENADPESRCSRCSRLNLQCEYRRSKRGPPKGRKRGETGRPSVDASAMQPRNEPVRRDYPNIIQQPQPVAVPNVLPPAQWEQPVAGPSVMPAPIPQAASAPPLDQFPPKGPQWTGSSLLNTAMPNGFNTVSHERTMHNDSMPAPINNFSGVPNDRMSAGTASLPPTQHPTSATDASTSPTPGNRRRNKATGDFFPPELADARHELSLTLEDHLEPHIGHGDSRPNSPQSSVPPVVKVLAHPDPVTMGLLTELEAQYLFRQFETCVCETASLFDPQFDTYARIRTSPVLFNAVLFAAASFFKPEISATLADMTETSVHRKLKAGDVDLDLIQSLLTQVYWTRHDQTAYVKLGLAVRLSQQLRLDFPGQATPADDILPLEQQRQKAYSQRMVLAAMQMESSYAVMVRLPAMSTEIHPTGEETIRWAERYAHLNVPGDFYRAFLSDMWDYYLAYRATATEGSNLHGPAFAEHSGLSALMNKMDRWAEHPGLRGSTRAPALILGKTGILKLLVLGLHYEAVSTLRVLEMARDIVNIIKAIPIEQMLFWNDVTCSVLSNVGVLLYKARQHFSPEELRIASGLCAELTAVFDIIPAVNLNASALGRNRRSYQRINNAFARYINGEQELPVDVTAYLPALLQGDSWSALAAATQQQQQEYQADPGPHALNPQWDFYFPLQLL